jgi:hypothetical protein
MDDFEYKAIFTITGGADVKKFTLAGDRLTFGCFVPMIADHILVKERFSPMIADHDLVKKR